MANDFKNLEVWKLSIEFAANVHDATKEFPKEEFYGLRKQIRDCSVSVPSNIAEGTARRSDKDFVRFLNIAAGSLSELETQLILAERFDYIANSVLLGLIETKIRVDKMLTKLRQSIERRIVKR